MPENVFMMYKNIDYILSALRRQVDEFNLYGFTTVDQKYELYSDDYYWTVNLQKTVQELRDDLTERSHVFEKFDIRREALLKVKDDKVEYALYKNNIIGFVVFFELLDARKPDDTLYELQKDITILVETWRYNESSKNYRLLPINYVEEDMLINIYRKYYREMDESILESIYAGISECGRKKLTERKAIRKFRL